VNCRFLAVLLIACASRSAFAQAVGAGGVAPGAVQQLPETPHAPRLRFAPWLGFAVPIGSAAPKLPISDLTAPPVLIGGDIAWGPSLSWDVGLTFFTGLGLGAPKVCPEPQRVNPWLGLGVGLEVLGTSSETTMSNDQILFESTTTTKQSDIYYGPLFGMLHAGIDFRVRRSVTLGGVVGFSLARFTNVKHTTSVEGQVTESSSNSLAATSFHEWLFLAVNGTFDVRL